MKTIKLSSLDNLFLQLESAKTPMHVAGLLIFSGDGRNRESCYERMLAARVTAPPFNWRLRPARLLGQLPGWSADSNIATGAHLQRHTLESGDDQTLMQTISGLHSVLFDRQRPLWGCHVIEGLLDNRYAYYYMVHHAAIDGATAITRMQTGLSKDPTEVTQPMWANAPSRRARGISHKRMTRIRRFATATLGQARVISEITSAVREIVRPQRRDRVIPVPFSAPNSPLNQPTLSGQRQVASHRLPLSEIREIGKARGATVNDVVLAIVAGVLRRYLLSIDGLPEQPLVALVPVSLRDETTQSVAGTVASAMLCSLATDIADPIERLQAIVASSRASKRMLRKMSKQAAAAYPLVVLFPAIALMMLGVSHYLPLPFNVVVSNVPGPREPLYDNGARLEAIYPVSMLWERQALNVTLLSYQDDLDFGLVATKEGIVDLQAFAGEITLEFELLKTL